MTDGEFLMQYIPYDYDVLHNFIERVGIILDSIENPTTEQLTAARNQAYLELI